MKKNYWIDARDKPGLLVKLMKELAGDALISFEGNLSECDFSELNEVSHEHWGEISRCDRSGKLDFKVFNLTSDTIQPILQQILPYGRVVHMIEHILIEKDGNIQFMSGDNFHNECISVGELVTSEILEKLKRKGLIRGYVSDAEVKAKYSRS